MCKVTPTICAKPVHPEELAGLLTALHEVNPREGEAPAEPPAGQFDYLIVADWRDLHFVRFADPCQEKWLAGSDSGRAFGPQAEVRWRRSEDGEEFLCRWISDGGPCPREGWKPPSEGEEQEPKSPAPSSWCGWKSLPESEAKDLTADPEPVGYLLWGEWLDEANCWYTARIPRRLEYPTDPPSDKKDKTPLTLKVCQYKRGGQVYFERFVGLGRYEKEEK